MLHFVLPSLVGFGAVIGLIWTMFACLVPSRSTIIWTVVFVLIWLVFTCTLMMACL